MIARYEEVLEKAGFKSAGSFWLGKVNGFCFKIAEGE